MRRIIAVLAFVLFGISTSVHAVSSSGCGGWDNDWQNNNGSRAVGLANVAGRTVIAIKNANTAVKIARINADVQHHAIASEETLAHIGVEGVRGASQDANEAANVSEPSASGSPTRTKSSQLPLGLVYFQVTNKRSEIVEILLDDNPTSIGIEPGKDATVELLPPAKLKARYSETKISGGSITVEWKKADVKADPSAPGPVMLNLPDGRTVRGLNLVVEP